MQFSLGFQPEKNHHNKVTDHDIYGSLKMVEFFALEPLYSITYNDENKYYLPHTMTKDNIL